MNSIKSILPFFIYSGYVVTCLSAKISPEYFSFFTLLSFAIVPYTLIVMITAILQIRLSKKKWVRGMAIFIILVSVVQMFKTFDWNYGSESGHIKVISLNASFFRIPTVFSSAYNNPVQPTINEQMVNWILLQQADILCIQEFFDDNRSVEYNNLALISEKGDYDYFYQSKSLHDNGISRGIVIFSRAPILSREVILMNENRFNGSIAIKIQIGNDTIQIVNTHLQSSMLAFEGDMRSPNGIKNNLKRLHNDARLKGEQVNEIINYLDRNPYPVIICGDLNSTRYSYVYNELKDHYLNAFNEAGFGLGYTYNGRIKLPLKIDHQFYREPFNVKSCKVDKSMTYSDHLPLIATYDYDKN